MKKDERQSNAFSQVMGQDDEDESVIDEIFGPRSKLPFDGFIE